jgi:membrane protein required for colicin V production
LTVLDAVVIVIVLISAVLAMVRGFVREVLSITSWIAAVAAAYFFYGPLLPLVSPYFESRTVASIVSAGVIFFVALIVASYITMKISDFVIDSRVGALDRALGFLFGAARGVLLVVIAMWFFNFLVSQPPDWVVNARSEPILRDLGEQLVAALPDNIEESIQSRIRGSEGAAGDSGPPPGDDEAGGDASNLDSGGLDRLIENSGSQSPGGN